MCRNPVRHMISPSLGTFLVMALEVIKVVGAALAETE
jgi:hypothetical protein